MTSNRLAQDCCGNKGYEMSKSLVIAEDSVGHTIYSGSLDSYVAPNDFLRALVADAIANGSATAADADGCDVTATVTDAE